MQKKNVCMYVVAQMVQNLPALQETWVWSLAWEDPLEEGKETHSSIHAWRIPWTEEPSRLQAIGLHGVKHDWTDLACMHREIIRIKKFIASYLFYYLMLVIIDIYWVYITQY